MKTQSTVQAHREDDILDTRSGPAGNVRFLWPAVRVASDVAAKLNGLTDRAHGDQAVELTALAIASLAANDIQQTHSVTQE